VKGEAAAAAPLALKERIRGLGKGLGFEEVGFAPPELPDRADRLTQWLEAGYQAGMTYMDRHREICLDPGAFFPEVKTIIAVALNYYLPHPANSPSPPVVSRFAWGRDYHRVLRGKLKRLMEEIRRIRPGTVGRIAVDTSPVLDKVWAAAAGVGWQGKHTNLITRSVGSWVFLGTLWIDLELPPDLPSTDYCGTCKRCLEACPTRAFPQPYVLDSRRCITYWNVEHRGEFGEETPSLNGWLFGCDVCQEVCPWNKFRRATPEEDFSPRVALDLGLEDWADLPRSTFEEVTRGSAMRRAGLEGLRRNGKRLLDEVHETTRKKHDERLQSERQGPLNTERETYTWKREALELESPLGLPIRGHVLTPDDSGENPPTVFILHGYKGFKDWGFFPLLAERLASIGLRAVGFNMSGSGVGSEGESFSETELFERNTYSQELEDVATVVRAFTRDGGGSGFPPSGPTAVFGHSRGGGIGLLAASRVPQLQTVVTWAAISRVDRWDEASRREWRERGFVEIVNSRTGQVFKLRTNLLDDLERNTGRLDIEAAVRGLMVPVLAVHGEKDESVGSAESRHIFGWKTAHTGRDADSAVTPAELARLPIPPEAALRWGPEGSLLMLLKWAGHTFDATHPLASPPPDRLVSVVETTAAWLHWHLLATRGNLP
jgi:epoxyqueuosine reductase